jgi:hypothetical protein
MELPQIYTGRWRNAELARLDCQPVSISRGDGRNLAFSYRKVWLLAPSKATFSMSDAAAAEQSYREGLDEIGVERIQARLQELAEESGLPLVLLCHENVMEGQECHRRWFASWWHEQTGQVIPELEPGMIEESDELRQPRLL